MSPQTDPARVRPFRPPQGWFLRSACPQTNAGVITMKFSSLTCTAAMPSPNPRADETHDPFRMPRAPAAARPDSRRPSQGPLPQSALGAASPAAGLAASPLKSPGRGRSYPRLTAACLLNSGISRRCVSKAQLETKSSGPDPTEPSFVRHPFHLERPLSTPPVPTRGTLACRTALTRAALQ